MGHPFLHEVFTAQSLAKSAGVMAKALKAASRHSQKENGEGPVSDADLQSDQIICDGLKQQFPDDLVISEERAGRETALPAKGRVWLVDPIDGTADYVRGGQDYCVMIGLLIDATPVLGIIYGPETNEMWTGVTWSDTKNECYFAERSTDNERPIALNVARPPHPTGPIIALSKHHPSHVIDQIVETLKPAGLIIKGSLGLKIALIADGKADFYAAASRKIKAWDTCAPFALLKASGGQAYTFEGGPVVFGPTCTHSTPFFAASADYAPIALKKLGVAK